MVGIVTLCACANEEAPTLSPFRVVQSWPALGADLVLGQVAGVALDSNENVWVFARRDQGWFGDVVTAPIDAPTLFSLDRTTGNVVASAGASTFYIPHGLFIDHNGHLWVTDVGLHIVVELDASGTILRTLGTRGEYGTDSTHFSQPTDVYVRDDGTIFIADGYGNSRVVVYSADGVYQREWGSPGLGPGEFNTPHSIVGDGNNRIYVADRGNSRIQVFDEEGTYIEEWRSPELGRPWAINITDNGDLYVLDGGDQDASNSRAKVMRLSTDGHVLESFGAPGMAAGEFEWPHDLAITSFDEVFVGEVHYGARVQKFVRGGAL